MQQGRARAIAICIIHRGDDIFVAEGRDPLKNQTFYRPLGGAIQFGEYGRQTVEHEMKEEIGAAISVGPYLGTIENVFTYNGQTGHEIVLIYRAEFQDKSFYERESVNGEDDGNIIFSADWKPLPFFQTGQAPLYPTGLLQLLEQNPE